jgi:alkylation response protein AidB-like acyl-CoA dehydrogenase
MAAPGDVPRFELFALPGEYDELRASVRALADAHIAPRAAHTDESAQFPWDVHAALAQSGFNAPHIPEKYGGAGADALATAIVV